LARQPRIEAYRVYSIILILIGHTLHFAEIDVSQPLAKAFGYPIAILARATIPFFFILSGFFLGGKIIDAPAQAISIARKYTWKLGALFLFWCAIYALADPYRSWILLTENPVRLIFEGTRVHLWFLASLFLTVWLFALWPMTRKSVTFLALGGILFVIGLLGGPYRLSALGLDLHFNTRDGIFFSTIFFGIGAWFHSSKPNVSKTTATWIFLAGITAFSIESIFLWSQYRLSPLYNDYVLGSIPYGIGLFLIAYRFEANRLDKLAAPFAIYVIGMYVSHMLIIDLLLKPFHRLFNPVLWQLTGPILLCLLTLAITWLIGQTRLRRLVGLD
jgi:surface polysaccharide O-acyltransferase-like enzyme